VRYGQEHKQATRQRIIETAGRRFKKDGIDGSGIAALMKDAGLKLRWQREEYSTGPPGRNGVEQMVREYLSAGHRDSAADGCPSAALLAEIGRCGEATRRAYTEGVLAIADEIAARLAPDDPPSARGQTLGLFAMLIGTLQLSRTLVDPRLADEVLEQGIKNALALMDADERA
jgi:AcrR family transcriptional regulator